MRRSRRARTTTTLACVYTNARNRRWLTNSIREMRDRRREIVDARRGVPPTARAIVGVTSRAATRPCAIISTHNFSHVTASRRKAIEIYALWYIARCNAITRRTRLWFSGKIFVSHTSFSYFRREGTNESPGFDSRWAQHTLAFLSLSLYLST